MSQDNTLLWVGLIVAGVFVLTKTKLMPASSGPSAIVPPASPAMPGTPAAAPSTAIQASAVPTAMSDSVDMFLPPQSTAANTMESPELAFGPYGY